MVQNAEASPVVVVPAKRSRRKVRFSEQVPMHIGHGSPGDQTRGNGQTSDDTVDVVVQMPSVAEATGDKSSNGPRREPDTTAEEGDEETDIFATHVGRGQVPTRDQDAAFRARYAEIKRLAWTWVQKHFPAVDPGAKRRLDLLRLAHTSPQLMEYANWVSCCGQKRTWEGVFAEQRAQLVYGMLGKVLEVHVFGHEMFGADREQLRELRELDMELLNKDGTCLFPFLFFFFPAPHGWDVSKADIHAQASTVNFAAPTRSSPSSQTPTRRPHTFTTPSPTSAPPSWNYSPLCSLNPNRQNSNRNSSPFSSKQPRSPSPCAVSGK